MPTLSKINDILCQNIAKIDDVLKGNAAKIDDISFCTPTATQTPTVTRTPTSTPGGSQTPTPSNTSTVTPTPTFTSTPTNTMTPTPRVTDTPTPTPTPTVTPSTTPCVLDCCFTQLCYSDADCVTACQCNDIRDVYLHKCLDAPCRLGNAFGIYDDKNCTVPSAAGYYSDGVECYYWDGSSSVTLDSIC